MRRSTLRFFAIFILALLGAPLAMHVILHDLHGHDGDSTGAFATAAHHGDHEHPVVSAPAPAIPPLVRSAHVIGVSQPTVPSTSTGNLTEERNLVSHGALRMDDDVGLQPLLSTYHI